MMRTSRRRHLPEFGPPVLVVARFQPANPVLGFCRPVDLAGGSLEMKFLVTDELHSSADMSFIF
jgi:hypothetical protein